MGTHPIFESDFDCLTEMRVSRVLRSGIRQGNFSNHHVKGIAKIENSFLEGKAFKEQFETWKFIPRSIRRFNESWYKWVPVIGCYYFITIWADAYALKEERKNPADFANDE